MENKALQAVSVSSSKGREQPYLFTFCLERIDQGPYKVVSSPCCTSQPLQDVAYPAARLTVLLGGLDSFLISAGNCGHLARESCIHAIYLSA